MGIHVGRRPIWLVRAAHCHGTPPATPETVRPSSTVIVPRAASLSEEGLLFAQRLGAFCRASSEQFHEYAAAAAARDAVPSPIGGSAAPADGDEAGLASGSSTSSLSEDLLEKACGCAIYTSTLPRAIQTASFVPRAGRPRASSALNPLDRGVAYGLTEEQFASRMRGDYERWRADVRNARFPGGESYADLILRLEPLLIELEQQTGPVLVVSHLSTLQVLTSYFTGVPLEEALATSIPHHTVLQLKPASHVMMWEKELIPLERDELILAPPRRLSPPGAPKQPHSQLPQPPPLMPPPQPATAAAGHP